MSDADRRRALLQIAKLQTSVYGEVLSPDAQAVMDAENKRLGVGVAKPARAMSPGLQVGTAILTLVMFLLLATFITALVDGIVVFVHYNVTIPSRCQPASPVFGPEPDVCSPAFLVKSCEWAAYVIYGLVFLIGIPAIVKQGMSGKKVAP
jgi:hypothetical protein